VPVERARKGSGGRAYEERSRAYSRCGLSVPRHAAWKELGQASSLFGEKCGIIGTLRIVSSTIIIRDVDRVRLYYPMHIVKDKGILDISVVIVHLHWVTPPFDAQAPRLH